MKTQAQHARIFCASVSAIALSVAAAPAAYAQDASQPTGAEEPDDSSVIVVSGIRASVESSQNIKRNADTFVDSVTAEDIGALPDRSVNETLQRIPGISISRFAAADDPDHFSVEGAGVVVRGLTFVRSELNGRDVFSANNGRALGFNDVSPELLGSVNVFKQQTADMIEGGLAGTVDLRTRKPFDKRELVLAGSIEGNYGDLRKKWSPTYSLFASNVWGSELGDFGIMLNYSKSKLFSANHGTQLADYTFYTDRGPDTVLVPRGAGVRQQTFDRERESYGGALQWEANDGSAKATVEYLRVEATTAWTENVFESAADQAYESRPVPGTEFEYDETGQFISGMITDTAGWRSAANCAPGEFDECISLSGFQHSLPKRQVDQTSSTEDLSLALEFRPTDRLTFNFDGQYVKSRTENLDFSIFGSAFANVNIDIGAGTPPDVGFSAPTPDGSDIENYFADPTHTFYRAAMDHLEDSEGEEYAFRGDVGYEFDDDSFLRRVSAGGRFSSRDQTTRFSVYNWGVISEIWNGSTGPVFFSDVEGSPQQTFQFPNFQRGEGVQPNAALYYGGDINAGYRDGTVIDDLIRINSQWTNPGWRPLASRSNTVDGTPFTQGEINDTKEETFASYLRLDFGSDDIFGGARLAGNIGLRYVNTKFQTRGAFQTVQPQDVFNGDCAAPTPGAQQVFCQLSPERQALALAFADGTAIPDTQQASFDNWLPSINLKLEVADGVIFRFGASKGISRPELGLTRNFFVAQSNLTNLGNSGADLTTAPLFTSDAGNPNLRPVEAWNYDLSAEYYFNATGSVTATLFYKELDNVITRGSEIRTVTNASGVTADVVVNTSTNTGSGNVKGFELAYNQFFDFLPGPLGGLGFQGNYTYIDSSDIPNPNLNPTAVAGIQPAPTIQNLPLQGLSKHNFNAALLYDKYGLSGRVAYSWRSQYLLTTRDVIFPFSPIWHDDTGQLDASLFYTINEHVKVGVQGVNLLNEVTVTRAQVDVPEGAVGANFDQRTLTPRSYFTNDRRYTFIARFSF